jgi:hypothetical protein
MSRKFRLCQKQELDASVTCDSRYSAPGDSLRSTTPMSKFTGCVLSTEPLSME